jgi:sugar phosphate isomerase/epimerase
VKTSFGIRRGVDPEGIATSLSGLGQTPFELALPYRLDDFYRSMDGLEAVKDFILRQGLRPTSIHAAQGRLSDDRFLDWARPTARFAKAMGVEAIVFHPEQCPMAEKENLKIIAMNHLTILQREERVTAVIETFGHRKRLFSPETIRDLGLPMCLDVSHLFEARTMEIVESYWHGIAVVHLSEADKDGRPHGPAGRVCRRVLRRLKELGWSGTVILEYLPDYHAALMQDRELLEKEWLNDES